MSDPRWAQHLSGRGRYYTRPSTGEQLISVTTVLDCAAKHALVPWAAKSVTEHAWQILPAMIAASRSTDRRDELTRELKSQPDVIRERASDLGTRVHRLAEAHVLGRPEPDDDEAAPYVEQYLRFLTDYGIEIDRDIEAAESTVINTRHGYAGTCDLRIRLPIMRDPETSPTATKPTPDGKRALWVADIKTSATKPATTVYDSFPLQLEAYRAADLVLLDDGTEVRAPNAVASAVLNLRADDYALIPLPIGAGPWHAFLGLLSYARWLHGDWRDQHNDYVPTTPTGAPRTARRRTRKAA